MSERITHNGIAVLVVVSLHALMVSLLWRLPTTSDANVARESGPRIRFLPRQAPVRTPEPILAARAASTRPARPAVSMPRAVSAPTAVQAAAPDPLSASTADLLAQGAAWANASAPNPDFGSDPLRQRHARLPGGDRPGRFVMRRSVSPEQVVRFIGLLFAGPGYDTDPCRRIRQNVDGLMTDLSDPGREQLGRELDEYAFRCMR